MASGTVNELREELLERAQSQPRISIGDINEEMSARGRGPFFLIPALVELTPIGSIPGVPTAIAIVLGLFAVQVLIGRQHMWLPGFVEKLSMRSEKVKTALGKLEKVADRMDHAFHDKWSLFVSEPFQRAAALVVLVLCCTIPVLELVPFASSVPMLAIAALGLAMLVRDGRVMVAAALILLLGGSVAAYFVFGR